MTCDQMREHGESTTSTRRDVILAAASGFSLAASGLLVPDWLEEAAAREGALGGARGGRSSKNHQRHRHKRTHGDRKKRRKPNDILPTHPAIKVYNKRSEPVQVRGWNLFFAGNLKSWFVPSGWDWAALPAVSPSGGISDREFPSDKYYMAVQIGTDRCVEYIFGVPFFAPDAYIYSGGWEFDGSRGAKLDQRVPIDIQESFSVPGIRVTRFHDTSSHVWLSVELV